MKRIFIILTLVSNSYSQYISPGVNLGYDFNSHFTCGLKVSLGVYENLQFINFTFGRSFALNKKSTYPVRNYFDIQYGKLSDTIGERKIQLFYGGGIGVVISNENGKQYTYPRLTTFTGNLLFLNCDIYFIKMRKVEPDLGFQLVLPVPLGERPTFGTGG